MTKIKVVKKKIKQRYDKNQDCLEKKCLSLGMTKSRLLRKLNKGMTKTKVD